MCGLQESMRTPGKKRLEKNKKTKKLKQEILDLGKVGGGWGGQRWALSGLCATVEGSNPDPGAPPPAVERLPLIDGPAPW